MIPDPTEKEAVWRALSPRQRAFVAALLRGATPSAAANEAGYASPRHNGAALARGARVAAALRALSVDEELRAQAAAEVEDAIVGRTNARAQTAASLEDAIAEREDLMRWWSAVMSDPDKPMAVRLRASEHLARAYGLFAIPIVLESPAEVEAREIEGARARVLEGLARLAASFDAE